MSEEFITRREFDATTRYYDRALGDMARANERSTTEVKDELRRLGEAIKTQAVSAADHTALGLHDVAKELRAGMQAWASTPRTGGQFPVRMVTMAVLAVCGLFAYRMALGHW